MYEPGGYGWRGRLGLLLALALFGFFLCAQHVAPQTSTESEPSKLLDELQRRLTSIRDNSMQLEKRLIDSQASLSESRKRAEELSSELFALSAELESWQNYSGMLQQQVTSLLYSLGALQERLALLSEYSASSEQLWQQALDRAKRRRIVCVILAALGGGLGGYFIAK